MKGPRFGSLGIYAVLYLAFVYIPVMFLSLPEKVLFRIIPKNEGCKMTQNAFFR